MIFLLESLEISFNLGLIVRSWVIPSATPKEGIEPSSKILLAILGTIVMGILLFVLITVSIVILNSC